MVSSSQFKFLICLMLTVVVVVCTVVSKLIYESTWTSIMSRENVSLLFQFNSVFIAFEMTVAYPRFLKSLRERHIAFCIFKYNFKLCVLGYTHHAQRCILFVVLKDFFSHQITNKIHGQNRSKCFVSYPILMHKTNKHLRIWPRFVVCFTFLSS